MGNADHNLAGSSFAFFFRHSLWDHCERLGRIAFAHGIDSESVWAGFDLFGIFPILVLVNRIKLLFCLLLLSLCLGCQLDDSPPLPRNDVELPSQPLPEDYRAPYYGNFAFTSYYWYTEMGNSGYRDTVNFDGYILPLKGTDSTLKIRYRIDPPPSYYYPDFPPLNVIHPTLKPDGRLAYQRFLFLYGHASFSGAFNTHDTVDIRIGSGGNGGQSGHVIHGVRVR